MTLGELHRKKPIEDTQMIEVRMGLSSFSTYIAETDQYDKVDYYRITIDEDGDYIKEVAGDIFTKCKVLLKVQHSMNIQGEFQEIRRYFDLDTLEIIEITPELIITEYRPNELISRTGRMPYKDITER